MSGDDQMFSVMNYADAALYAALDEDFEVAIYALDCIIDHHGVKAMYPAILRWCDAYHEHAVDGQDTVGLAHVSVMDERTGKLQRHDDPSLEPVFRWASQVVVSRTNHDIIAFNALWDALGDLSPRDRGTHIMTLLVTISRTIRGMPRGFALMGMDVLP